MHNIRALRHMIKIFLSTKNTFERPSIFENFPITLKFISLPFYICSHSSFAGELDLLRLYPYSIYSFCLFSFSFLTLPSFFCVHYKNLFKETEKENFHISYCAISICMMLLLFTEWEIWLYSLEQWWGIIWYI